MYPLNGCHRNYLDMSWTCFAHQPNTLSEMSPPQPIEFVHQTGLLHVPCMFHVLFQESPLTHETAIFEFFDSSNQNARPKLRSGRFLNLGCPQLTHPGATGACFCESAFDCFLLSHPPPPRKAEGLFFVACWVPLQIPSELSSKKTPGVVCTL